jgi:hypothetical protein
MGNITESWLWALAFKRRTITNIAAEINPTNVSPESTKETTNNAHSVIDIVLNPIIRQILTLLLVNNAVRCYVVW